MSNFTSAGSLLRLPWWMEEVRAAGDAARSIRSTPSRRTSACCWQTCDRSSPSRRASLRSRRASAAGLETPFHVVRCIFLRWNGAAFLRANGTLSACPRQSLDVTLADDVQNAPVNVHMAAMTMTRQQRVVVRVEHYSAYTYDLPHSQNDRFWSWLVRDPIMTQQKSIVAVQEVPSHPGRQ